MAVVVAVMSQAQMPTGPSAAEVEAMKKLDFIVGKWEGEGWLMAGAGKREVFKGTENVQAKLHGKALLVDGHFLDPKDNRTVHETLAIITYDEKAKKCLFKTYLFNRPGGEFELTVIDKGFSWELHPPNGPKVLYTMKLNEKGEWIESGEVMIEGREPLKFLEMRLAKK